MAFSSATTGYVSVLASSRLAFTQDGGRSWSTVRSSGQATAVILQGRSLWVTSQHCPSRSSNPSLCPTMLATYVVGQPAPTTIEAIPTEGPITTGAVHSDAFQATVLTRRGNEALASEGQQGLPVSILRTIDAGRSWTLVDNPCGDLGVTGLVQGGPAQWYLYCSLDGGMHQGTNQLWATIDRGAHWTLNGEGAVQGPALGNIGSVMSDDLTASGNGDVLWTLGSVGGLGYSTDGGHAWGGVGLPTGGYPAAIATAGGTEAWLPLPSVGLYRTLDGTRWTRLS
jgi:hypothetical protein